MIDVKGFVAVPGISGISKLISVTPSGIIIENIDSKERKFVAMRSHDFSPFETISIYTTADSTLLGEVLATMKAQLSDNPPPPEKAASPVLRGYFTQILPTHDPDRVHISDIKKIIKWFNYLNTRDLLKEVVVEEEVAVNAAEEI